MPCCAMPKSGMSSRSYPRSAPNDRTAIARGDCLLLRAEKFLGSGDIVIGHAGHVINPFASAVAVTLDRAPCNTGNRRDGRCRVARLFRSLRSPGSRFAIFGRHRERGIPDARSALSCPCLRLFIVQAVLGIGNSPAKFDHRFVQVQKRCRAGCEAAAILVKCRYAAVDMLAGHQVSQCAARPLAARPALVPGMAALIELRRIDTRKPDLVAADRQ